MIKNKPQKSSVLKDVKENICDFNYLTEMMGEKKSLIIEIMNVFLNQIPEELKSINNAIPKTDYTIIKNIAHSMKSSVSIMGIAVLIPILGEMEELGKASSGIEKIKQLNQKLNSICKLAIKEIEDKKQGYA